MANMLYFILILTTLSFCHSINGLLLTTHKKLVYPQWIKLVKEPLYRMKNSVRYNPIEMEVSDVRADFGMFGDTDQKADIIIPMGGEASEDLNFYLVKSDIGNWERIKRRFPSSEYSKLRKFFHYKRRKGLKKGAVAGSDGIKYPMLIDPISDGKMKSIFKYDGVLYTIEPAHREKLARKLTKDRAEYDLENAHVIYRI